MTRAPEAAGAALAATLALAACAAPGLDEAPKSVTGHALPSREIHEECLKLVPGDRLEYAFESAEPLDFNIHYHEGKTVVMPISREATRAEAGVFAARIAHDYCLMWQAGPQGATLDYRVRFRPAPR